MKDDSIHSKYASPKPRGWYEGYSDFSETCGQSKKGKHTWFYHHFPRDGSNDYLRVCVNCSLMTFAPEGYPYYAVTDVDEYRKILEDLRKKAEDIKLGKAVNNRYVSDKDKTTLSKEQIRTAEVLHLDKLLKEKHPTLLESWSSGEVFLYVCGVVIVVSISLLLISIDFRVGLIISLLTLFYIVEGSNIILRKGLE